MSKTEYVEMPCGALEVTRSPVRILVSKQITKEDLVRRLHRILVRLYDTEGELCDDLPGAVDLCVCDAGKCPMETMVLVDT